MRIADAARFVFAGLALSGCASAGFHQVQFAGEGSAASLAPSGGRTVHVVRNTEMKDTILEARIRSRLESFLLEQGYVITSADTAQLYVLATFGAGERMVASTAAVFRPAEATPVRNREGQVVGKRFNPDRMEYLRVPMLQNSVWLQVLSSDARFYRQTGTIRNLWRGESAMAGTPQSLASSAKYLLVPALKYFGRGTDEILTLDVRDNDIAWRNAP
ncbi:MAG: hypothetical protein ABI681_06190 [Gemmatimonadales bacterium]